MGLGRHGGGVAAARWAAQRGAFVTVTDLATEAELADSLRQLSDVSISRWRLGEHCDDDFRQADVVVVNPAIRPGNYFVEIAAAAGACIISEIELFLEHCRGHVIGVTGSNGKSTTASMLAAVLAAEGRRTWLGGNIGRSLLPEIDAIGPDDWVVLELSSFQLHWLSPAARFPELAIVTNCAPNHLDWHPTWNHYRAAKQRLLTEQPTSCCAVLGESDEEVVSWRNLMRGKCLLPWDDSDVPALVIAGTHNRRNAACAAAVAEWIGCEPDGIRAALSNFAGLPHRLQWVAEASGRRFYNDSKATTPEAAAAALEALIGPVWLLAGGSDKGSDLTPMVRATATLACGAALFGTTGPGLQQRITEHHPSLPCTAVATMQEAFEWCLAHSRTGDAILLSPGCASLDQFRDYAERGERFVQLVRACAR